MFSVPNGNEPRKLMNNPVRKMRSNLGMDIRKYELLFTVYGLQFTVGAFSFCSIQAVLLLD
jgi:hypothetical protein